MDPDISTALQQRKYYTLVLIEAFTWGWEAHVDISQREAQILMWIAKHGKNNETGVAFAWFPYKGQEWWAASLGMSGVALRKGLERLRKKGLIINLKGSVSDPRYRRKRGYAIPLPVMEQAVSWAADREAMLMDVTPCHIEEAGLRHPVTSNVTPCHIENPIALMGVGLSGSNPGDNPGTRETHSLTGASEARTEDSMDDFDVPRDSLEDAAWAAPRDPKPTRRYQPSTRITNVFEECWVESKKKRPSLTEPWSSVTGFRTNLKRLMAEGHTEEEIISLVEKFFTQLNAGKIQPRSDELWKDFWNNRTRLMKLVGSSTTESLRQYYAERDRRREAQS